MFYCFLSVSVYLPTRQRFESFSEKSVKPEAKHALIFATVADSQLYIMKVYFFVI